MRRLLLLMCALVLAGCVVAGEDPDADGDGYLLADDCEPDDPDVYPGAPDAPGDGLDTNCDGIDGTDADFDGFPDGEDCDDEDSDIHPDATDWPGDGIDQDCDGVDAT